MAGNHVDASILYVPIMPETSKLGEAMEQVGKDATESFGKGSEKLGDKITDSFTKSKDKIKDVFHRSGSDASEAMADGVKKNSSKVEDALEDTGKKGGGKLRDAISDALPDGLSKGGSKLDGLAQTLGAEVGKRLGTGIGNELEKIDDYAKKVGIDISGWTGPIKDAADPFSTLQDDAKNFESQITGVSSMFEGMPGKVGLVGKAITELAAPLAMVEQALEKINDLFDKAGGQRKWNDVVNPPGQPNGFWDQAGRLFQSWVPGGTNTGDGKDPHDFWGAHSPGFTTDPTHGMLLPGGTGNPRTHDFWGGHSPMQPSTWGSGGSIPTAVPQGALPNVRGAHQDLAYILGAIQQQFPWVKLTAGKDDHPVDQGWHGKGQALDLGGGSAAQQAQLSNWLVQFAPEIEELIHQGPGNTQNVKSGRTTPAIDMQGSVYNTGQAGYHGDHVHLAVTDAQGQALYAAMTGGAALPPGALGSGGSAGIPRQAGAAASSFASSGGKIPTGAEHDPLYVSQTAGAAGGGGGGSDVSSQGQQLGSGLVDGLFQGLGLDGSVFKTFGGSSNPLQFGITKLATGLFNNLGGMLSPRGGDGAALPGGGGGGGGIPGLGALQGLIPGAAVSHGVVPTPGQSPTRGSEGVTNNTYHGDVQPFNVTQNIGQGESPTGAWKQQYNAQVAGGVGPLP